MFIFTYQDTSALKEANTKGSVVTRQVDSVTELSRFLRAVELSFFHAFDEQSFILCGPFRVDLNICAKIFVSDIAGSCYGLRQSLVTRYLAAITVIVGYGILTSAVLYDQVQKLLLNTHHVSIAKRPSLGGGCFIPSEYFDTKFRAAVRLNRASFPSPLFLTPFRRHIAGY